MGSLLMTQSIRHGHSKSKAFQSQDETTPPCAHLALEVRGSPEGATSEPNPRRPGCLPESVAHAPSTAPGGPPTKPAPGPLTFIGLWGVPPPPGPLAKVASLPGRSHSWDTEMRVIGNPQPGPEQPAAPSSGRAPHPAPCSRPSPAFASGSSYIWWRTQKYPSRRVTAAPPRPTPTRARRPRCCSSSILWDAGWCRLRPCGASLRPGSTKPASAPRPGRRSARTPRGRTAALPLRTLPGPQLSLLPVRRETALSRCRRSSRAMSAQLSQNLILRADLPLRAPRALSGWGREWGGGAAARGALAGASPGPRPRLPSRDWPRIFGRGRADGERGARGGSGSGARQARGSPPRPPGNQVSPPPRSPGRLTCRLEVVRVRSPGRAHHHLPPGLLSLRAARNHWLQPLTCALPPAHPGQVQRPQQRSAPSPRGLMPPESRRDSASAGSRVPQRSVLSRGWTSGSC